MYKGNEEEKQCFDTVASNSAIQDQCGSREKCSKDCFRKAEDLRHQASKLEELGKLIDFMPKEFENTLYPIIMDYLYKTK